MSISRRSGVKGAPKIDMFEVYYNVLKWKCRFTLGLNAAKNTEFIKKMLHIKIVEN